MYKTWQSIINSQPSSPKIQHKTASSFMRELRIIEKAEISQEEFGVLLFKRTNNHAELINRHGNYRNLSRVLIGWFPKWMKHSIHLLINLVKTDKFEGKAQNTEVTRRLKHWKIIIQKCLEWRRWSAKQKPQQSSSLTCKTTQKNEFHWRTTKLNK